LLAAVSVLGGLLVVAQPAAAAPAPPDTSGSSAAAPAAPGQVWHPDVKKPAPVTLPGTNRTVTPFASKLSPAQPTALPGVRKGAGSVLQADGTSAGKARKAGMHSLGAAAPAASPDDPPVGLYCTEQVTRYGSVTSSPNQLDYAANLSYLAEFGCNFYLAAAYVGTGVIDRGRFDGQYLSTTTPVGYGQTSYGATSGALSIPGEFFDGGRSVEIIYELYLLAPYGIPWGGCFAVPLRYLLCEGLGTDLLHIVLGTGAFSTGLQAPVVRYTALGDSYSSGTGAPPYTDAQCRRSPVTYSSFVAGSSVAGLPVDQPVRAACHGAKTIDMYTSQHPGYGPQLDFIRPNTRLVTLTIGGNDLGFSDRLTGCVLTADCSGGGPLVTPEQLYQTQVQLTALYRQIRAEMRSDGKLLVMSYPKVLPDPDDATDPQPTPERCPGVNGNLNEGERRLISQATAQVDRMIRDAVIATGVSGVIYVNGLDLFRGHRVCAGTGNEWANGFVLSSISDSFHPNAAGYQAMATAFNQALN
jgi:lysophospholipase L1-like esterase